MLNLINRIQHRFEHRAFTAQRARRLHQISVIAILRHNRYSASPQAVEHARAYLSVMQEMGDSDALPAAHFQLGFTTLWPPATLKVQGGRWSLPSRLPSTAATFHLKHVAMMLVPELEEFARAIQENRSPAITIGDGRRVLRILDAVIQSDRCKQPVRLINA